MSFSAKAAKVGIVSFAAFTLLVPLATRAQSSAARGTTTTTAGSTTTATAPTKTTSTTTTSNTTQTTSPTSTNQYGYGPSSGNMNSGAKDSKNQAIMGVALNGVTAAMWFGKCSSNNYYACVLGAMHVVQAGMMLQGAKGAGKTQAATMYGAAGSFGYDQYGDYGADGAGAGADMDGNGIPDAQEMRAYNAQLNREEQKLNDLRSKFANLGYTVSADGKSVTLPNGKTVPTSAFTSKQGLMGLGLTADQIASYEQDKAAIAASLKEKAKALTADEGGGGGGGAGGGGAFGRRGRGAGDENQGFNYGSLFGDKKDRKTASVKGLSKQLGNDRIGVQADNIFEMMTRQYKKEEGKQSFIAPVGAAVPATVGP